MLWWVLVGASKSGPKIHSDSAKGDRMARRRATSRKRSGNWISGAVKRPGQLHRDLGIPQGRKIPRSKLLAAARQGGKTGQRARFALNVSRSGGRRSASRGKTHAVRSHTRVTATGRRVRVRAHRRRHPRR